jgi:hypothetical protein
MIKTLGHRKSETKIHLRTPLGNNNSNLGNNTKRRRKLITGEIRVGYQTSETNHSNSLLILGQALMYQLGRRKEEKIVRVVQAKKSSSKNSIKKMMVT